MPQKRNAFVFEAVRGRAAAAIGALDNVLVGQKNVPFANSIEGGTAASGHAVEQAKRTIEAMRLLALLVTSLEPQPDRGASMIKDQFTWVAGATEMIAGRHDLPYRQVHEIFGRTLREREIVTAEQLIAAVAIELDRAGVGLDEEAHAELRSLAGVGAIANMRYGGGPAPDSVTAQLVILDAHIAEIDEARHERTEAAANADARRRDAIDDYVAD
jgi:argininosuccinate lyase